MSFKSSPFFCNFPLYTIFNSVSLSIVRTTLELLFLSLSPNHIESGGKGTEESLTLYGICLALIHCISNLFASSSTSLESVFFSVGQFISAFILLWVPYFSVLNDKKRFS